MIDTSVAFMQFLKDKNPEPAGATQILEKLIPISDCPLMHGNAYLQATGASIPDDELGTFGDFTPPFVTEAQFATMQPLHLKLAKNKTLTITRDAQILPRNFTGSPEFGGTPGRSFHKFSSTHYEIGGP